LPAAADGKQPWVGPCPNCGHIARAASSWDGDEDTDEEPIDAPNAVSFAQLQHQAQAAPVQMLPTGLGGFDWMMGGGLPMIGIGVLIAGPSGCGKSSFTIELLRSISRSGIRTIYVSSEESNEQIRYRYERFGAMPNKMRFCGKRPGELGMNIDYACDVIDKWRPRVAVVDSLHDLNDVADDNFVQYSMGSSTAVVLAAKRLRSFAMQRRMVVVMVSHVTKGGAVAGANDVQHDTDVPLYLSGHRVFENGEWKISGPDRVLSFHGKMRYGYPGRRSHYEMADDGLHDRGPWMRNTLPWEKDPMMDDAVDRTP
jgi:DNA repair protein RadA/Sms